ncbi:hypothetical protein F3Y22_tig00009024pilonHSYRG00002 [Hibiscus syriacus]|uniref:P-type ATPase A domain-containing protein n=1 Tax=Hibiscus syriacus TaxID=106335 RepID=A0A6A3C6V6_HIBSY|nr:hypothetical protein F3Y22_tig00009024pilonHSYRG00002 [Hibiscus syriacus]
MGIEFFNISQIVASLAVLAVSRNEKPQAPLFTWIVGYVAGCAFSIPILFQHCFLPYPTRVMMMLYIDGIPILNLGDEMAKRGINPGGKMAAASKNIKLGDIIPVDARLLQGLKIDQSSLTGESLPVTKNPPD